MESASFLENKSILTQSIIQVIEVGFFKEKKILEDSHSVSANIW